MLNVSTEGGGGTGILCQSKSVLVTCVLVHVALLLELGSADIVKTVNFVPSELSLCTVWLGLVSAVTLGIVVNMVSSHVSVGHVKNKLSSMLIFFLFFFFMDLQQSKCRGWLS